MTSLSRSTRTTHPVSSTVTTSPVRSQPSSSSCSRSRRAAASSRRRPAGRGSAARRARPAVDVARTSAGSTTRICVLGNGRPRVPGRRPSVSGLPSATGDVSVIPYPSITRPPVACSQRSARRGRAGPSRRRSRTGTTPRSPGFAAAGEPVEHRRDRRQERAGQALLGLEDAAPGRSTGTRRASRRRGSRSSGTSVRPKAWKNGRTP